MTRFTLLLFLIVSAPSLYGQFGVSGFYNFNDARAVGDDVNPAANELLYEHGQEIALNYWFRLPTRRIEFQPTAYYTFSPSEVGYREAGFQFKTNLYVFDLGTDCDCPTFGKQGPKLEKGFFLQLSPGISHHWLRSEAATDVSQTALSLGAGIGLDFGITNLLTLTPILSVRHTLTDFTGVDFTDENDQSADISGRLTSYQVGLQATFRLDKKRY